MEQGIKTGRSGINPHEERKISGFFSQCTDMACEAICRREIGVEMDSFPKRKRVMRDGPPRRTDVLEASARAKDL